MVVRILHCERSVDFRPNTGQFGVSARYVRVAWARGKDEHTSRYLNGIEASLSSCARCGATDLEDREIEKLVRGGDDVAALRVLNSINLEQALEPVDGDEFLGEAIVGDVAKLLRDAVIDARAGDAAEGLVLADPAEGATDVLGEQAPPVGEHAAESPKPCPARW